MHFVKKTMIIGMRKCRYAVLDCNKCFPFFVKEDANVELFFETASDSVINIFPLIKSLGLCLNGLRKNCTFAFL